MNSSLLSIVVPVYNEESVLPAFYERLISALKADNLDFEIIFVNDGSTDSSRAAIEKINKSDGRVKMISLSRNFGHQLALTAGLDHASGDAAILMDSDLQHPPEVIRELLHRWREGFEVVYAVRRSTNNIAWFKNLSSKVYYKAFNMICRTYLPENAADFRLLDRRVVVALKQIRERNRFLRGLTGWVGFKSTIVTYDAGMRFAGETKFTLGRMFRLAIDGIVSFSAAPLYISIYLGLALATLGFLYMLFVLYARVVLGTVVPGWTSLIIMVSVIGGVQLILLGLVGIYIGQIYDEVKQRPLYLIEKSLGINESESPL